MEANLIRAHSVQELSDVRVYLFKMMNMYLREGGMEKEKERQNQSKTNNGTRDDFSISCGY